MPFIGHIMSLLGRKPTVLEQDWLNHSFQIPCLACRLFHNVEDSPAEYHHINGKTKPGAHFAGFSLCSKHHRISDTIHPKRWVSRHGDGKRIFQDRYMPEGAFLKEQQKQVLALRKRTIGGYCADNTREDGRGDPVSNKQ